MPCVKDLLLAGLHFAGTLLPHQSPSTTDLSPTQTTIPSYLQIPGEFSQVLSSLPAEPLHAALHAHLPAQFKDGMFEKDHAAVEAIHVTNAPLATRLVAAARYELLRRQAGNITTTNTAVLVPVPATTTDASGSLVTTTLTALSSATASVVVAVTSTNSAGQTVVTSANVPAVVLTQANGQVTTSPAPTLNPSGNAVLTSTDAAGNTFVTTYTPAGGVVSSLVVETLTQADGTRRTVTSYAVVPASKTASPSGSGPKLTGAASTKGVSLQGVLVAAIVFAALLL